ncbi:MAG: hypothetical protein OEO77_02525, partial [Acidimicrobiia bacterium]|nr:hypothetical protein [Acidimicrobiia bacterium]
MDSTRVLGPPPALKVVGVGVLVAATAGALVEEGPTSLAFAALAVVVAWRLFGLSGSFDGRTLDLR